jgi:hypothetical protein
MRPRTRRIDLVVYSDGGDCVGENGDADDVVLEQVAEALGIRSRQLKGVAALDALRQQQDGQVRPAAAGLGGGHGALVGVGRRHPDVDEGRSGRWWSMASRSASPSP